MSKGAPKNTYICDICGLYETTRRPDLERHQNSSRGCKFKQQKREKGIASLEKKSVETKQDVILESDQLFDVGDAKSSRYPTVNIGQIINAPYSMVSLVNSGIFLDQKNLHLNTFCDEFFGHISTEEILSILNSEAATTKSTEEIARTVSLKVAMLLFHNEKFVENLTCFMSNQKRGIAMVNGGSGWVSRPSKDVQKELGKRVVDVLFKRQPSPGTEGMDDAESLDASTSILSTMKDLDPRPEIVSEMSSVLQCNKIALQSVLGRLPSEKEVFPAPDPIKRTILRPLGDLSVFKVVKALKKFPPSGDVDEKYSEMLLLYCARTIGGYAPHLRVRALERTAKKIGQAASERNITDDLTLSRLKRVHEFVVQIMLRLADEGDVAVRRLYQICEHTNVLCRCGWWDGDTSESQPDDGTTYDINDLLEGD